MRHVLLAAAALVIAAPATAAIEFTGSFDVAGDATDLSGLGSALGANRLSFGSDLVFDRNTNLFYGLADRGPGGGVLPFETRVQAFRLRVDAATGAPQGFVLEDTILFRRADGTPFNGLNPRLLNGDAAVLGNSFDPEGVVRRSNGNFLVSDEYGPSVYEFDATGVFVRAFTTPANLVPRQADGVLNYVDGRPTITTGRQDNRGFEGLTLSEDGTKAYGILQDPLVDEGRGGQGRRSRNLRIVEFDVATGESTAQYAYQLESIDTINTRTPGQPFDENQQGRSIGVSSITALPDGTFLVIERDNRGLGVDDPTGANPVSTKRVYRISLDGATDVADISFAGSSDLPAGVTAVTKTLFLDVQETLQAAGQGDTLEKLEGLAFGRDLTTGGLSLYLVTDNDFSVTQSGAGEQFDICTAGEGGPFTSVVLGAGCPDGQFLIPSRIYAFAVTGDDAAGLAVPEPATWALMIAGFGLVGMGLRRRRPALA